MRDRFDAIIIGAGAAGLAAARDLSISGKSICVIEARQRLGGRIWSLHTPDLPLPIELGAEFVHGEPPETLQIADAAALLVHQLPDNHWWARRGRWELRNEFWETIQRVLARIPEGAHDVSFADFLKRQRRLEPRVRQMATSFAEGFNAAHADRISAASLKEDAAGGEWKQFRIANGYDAVIEWLRAGIDPERSSVRLGDAVTNVAWRRGDVEVTTARGSAVRARAAIVTVPIGVWKEPSAIRFTPPLRAKSDALAKLEVGHVVKIVFRFREAFWDEAGFVERRAAKRHPPLEGPLNFVHSSDRFMPTWWTTAPVRSPLLTGWAGGNAADRLLAEGHAAVVDRAIESLASVFGGVTRRQIDLLLDATWTHDWQSDPFSRGAYSYTGVGGMGAHDALARPLSSTLFFAGEATTAEQTGTVAGAIATGRRAARECLLQGGMGSGL
ncbi:MAG TPA: NAD(P)/FAD-dependent oxidoreductase [Thermoanaerobaculia bacterium]|nr:NAD(P)/FAD-dependent oxidoreductase [Thermoanaerobaculia bacterium]